MRAISAYTDVIESALQRMDVYFFRNQMVQGRT
jgi:hypothetical protein